MGERPSGPAGACSLAILARDPEPGQAKTRLAPALGPEGAAALHALLVRRTVRSALAAAMPSTTLWCAPGRDTPFFADLAAAHAVALRDQPPGDLGERMLAAFQDHLARGGPAILIGTDCPGLGPAHLHAARDALAGGSDAVLVPAEDGGYALLGLYRVHPRVFEGVPWGTSSVLAETRARLRSLRLATRELPPLRDVDRPEDLTWLLGAGLLDEDERLALSCLLGPGC